MLLLAVAYMPPAHVYAAPLPNASVESPKRPNLDELVRTSDIVVFGRFDTSHQSKTLRRRVEAGTLVNYNQNFHVFKYIKGFGPKVLSVVSTGIEPMPDPDNPWNEVYPGPMAEGMYICFLTKGESPYYYINGRWQGVYPVRDGKTIALSGAGFAELNGLTMAQTEEKVKAIR